MARMSGVAAEEFDFKELRTHRSPNLLELSLGRKRDAQHEKKRMSQQKEEAERYLSSSRSS